MYYSCIKIHQAEHSECVKLAICKINLNLKIDCVLYFHVYMKIHRNWPGTLCARFLALGTLGKGRELCFFLYILLCCVNILESRFPICPFPVPIINTPPEWDTLVTLHTHHHTESTVYIRVTLGAAHSKGLDKCVRVRLHHYSIR